MTPTLPFQVSSPRSTVSKQLDVRAFSPALQLVFEEQFGRIARPVQDDHSPEEGALIQHLVDQGAQRRQTQTHPARRAYLCRGSFQWGNRARNGPRMPTLSPALRLVQGAGHIAHLADAQLETVSLLRLGELLMLIGASPTPSIDTSTNCPGRLPSGRPSGSSQGEDFFQGGHLFDFHDVSHLRDEELARHHVGFSHRSSQFAYFVIMICPPISCRR